MCQERRSESWKRISCRHQVRRIISVMAPGILDPCKEIYDTISVWFSDCAREVRTYYKVYLATVSVSK